MLTRSMTRKWKLADEGQGSSMQEVEIKSSRKKGRMKKEKKYHVQLSKSISMFCDKKLSEHGEVYEGEQRHGDIASLAVAIKLVENDEHSKAEARILAKLNHHSHVIALIEDGFFNDGIKDRIYMVLDRCHNENLREFVANRKAQNIPFDFDLAIEIAKQIVDGVEYIHDKNVIHKDLKPDNILFTLNQKTIKIADFGLSEEIESPSTKVFRKEQFGTNGFRPIESFGNSVISQKSDIFSLGAVFYFIFSDGESPFGKDPLIWNNNILEGIFDLSCLLVPNVKTSQHLIKYMIDPKLNDRPTIWQVSRHPCWTGNEVDCDFDYHSDGDCDIPSVPEEQIKITGNINDWCKFLGKLESSAHTKPGSGPRSQESTTLLRSHNTAPASSSMLGAVGGQLVFLDAMTAVANVQVTKSTSEAYTAHLSDSSIYTIEQHRRKGRVLIINNEFLGTSIQREGSQVAVKNMAELWRKMGFDIEIKPNLTAQRMMYFCRQFAQETRDVSVVVVIIMSHGGRDHFVGEDQVRTYIADIVFLFNSNQSRHLRGIPKFFLLHTCRQIKKDVIVDAETEEPEVQQLARPPKRLDRPMCSDMLITISSSRNTAIGNFLVNAITHVFMRHAHCRDVEEMLTTAGCEIAEKLLTGRSIQTSHTMTKRLFLFPGWPN